MSSHHATTALEGLAASFRRDGVVMIEYALLAEDLTRFESLYTSVAPRRLDLANPAAVGMLTSHTTLNEIAAALIGPAARLVRVVLFDKSPDANWFVPWHQDRTVALAARREAPGYTNWTIKDGSIHAEPPVDLLERIVTLRIHLDDCDEANGPLEVALGTHKLGLLSRTAIEAALAKAPARLCLATRGDILAMSPLVLHRSQRASLPRRRRVLHLEYASAPLPLQLAWAIDIPPTTERLQ